MKAEFSAVCTTTSARARPRRSYEDEDSARVGGVSLRGFDREVNKEEDL